MENIRYKILLVEDDQLDQQAFERLVENEALPYDYTIAGSVSQAKSILDREQFDTIICDYLIGQDTAFDILELVKNTPVIVVTGTGNEEIAVNAWRAGAYDYLTKDIERSYLKALPITVANAIRHKKAEENLRLLSGAIMSTVDSVYITDIDNKITFVNKAFCDTYGYKKEEVLGKDSNILWLVGPKTADTRAVFRTQGVGGTWEVGFYHRRKDGSIFPASLSRSIIKDANGKKIAVVGTARDITEHVLAEDELRKTNSKLKEQDKLKSELAIRICEVVKELLAETNIVDKQSQKKRICPYLEKAKKMTSDFLDILQIDAGKLKLELAEFSLRSVVSEVVEALSPLADKKEIELQCCMPFSQLLIQADRERIAQALTELISNSIDSTSVKGHIKVRLQDTNGQITVEVQDDRPSTQSSKMDKIFDDSEWIKEQPYWHPQEDLSLGLVVAKKIIEMHGGCVWIENTEASRGHNFCLSLPKPGAREQFSMTAKAVGLSQANQLSK